jgi:vacuolar-type H+-ATPase subunit I/STV1
MATKTTNKGKAVLPDWQQEISEELDRADQRRRAAYAIMFRAAGGDELTREEIAFLNVTGFDEVTRRREQPKFSRALALLKKAGPKAEREAAAAQLAEREASLSATIGGLQTEIDRLTSELSKANSQLTAVRSNAQSREAAVAELRADAALPTFIRSQLDELRKAQSASEPARAEREAESRIRTIQSVMAISDNRQRELHAASVKLSDGTPLLINSIKDGKLFSPEVNPTSWARYLVELQEELPLREAELAAARKEMEYFANEGDDLRDYWLSPEIEQQVLEMRGAE